MKKSILFGMLCAAAMALSGCLNPHLSSMGASQMIVAHQPRLTVNGDTSSLSVSVDAYGGAKMTGRNIKDGFTGGGAAALNYRPFGFASPFYLEAAFGGKGGKASFDCTEGGKCNDGYTAWLTEVGKEKFSFWSLQERLSMGADFDLGPVILGLGAGFQIFEGGGDFDDIRDYLGKQNLAENDDEGYGVKLYSSARLGARLGQNGVIMLESGFMWLKTLNIALTLGYYHPSGFHGGVFAAEKVGFGVNFGKTFSF